jgi:hypothetical protein
MTGLETAIIIVSFVITAAAFSFVIIYVGWALNPGTSSDLSLDLQLGQFWPLRGLFLESKIL